MTSTVFDLATVDATQFDLGKRVPPPKTKIRNDSFWDGYDATTLIYDCFWQEAQRRVRLICPKLFNFEKALKAATFICDGVPVRPRLRRFARFDVVDLPSRTQPSALEITIGQKHTTVNVNIDSTQRYQGRQALYTMLKNEPLGWVCDWVGAHVRNHGVNAVIIANNNSTIYTSAELGAAIADIDGIKIADVIDVPLAHAPNAQSTSRRGRASFLQTACLNLVRDRFLMQACAVLQCDVDELVMGPVGESIFDATVASPLKYTTFKGAWRYVDRTNAHPRHADHVRADLRGEVCAPKYCIVPNSILGRCCWSVHGLERLNRRWFKPPSRFQFYHCNSINTSWKHKRDTNTERIGEVDPATRDFMARTFPHADADS